MKRRFRFLLAFDSAEGTQMVAEFNSNEEYLNFKRDLDEKGTENKLINEREFEGLKYKGAQYIDLRD